MASVVDICNLALSHLGAKQSVEQVFPTPEQSTEAKTCHLHYQPALDAILAEHDWGFARVTRALALAGTAPGDWTYSYAYPSDCLAAREIVNETKASTIREPDKIPFDLGYDTMTKVSVIYTDQTEAVLRYTTTLSNTTRFTPTFVEALAWGLAWRMANKLTGGKKDRREMAAREYEYALSRAKTADRREQADNIRPLPKTIRSRR